MSHLALPTARRYLPRTRREPRERRILFTFQYYPPLRLGGGEVGGEALAGALGGEADVLGLAPSWGGQVGPRPALKTFPWDGRPGSVADAARMLAVATRAARRTIQAFEPDWILANSPPAAVWSVAAAMSTRPRPRVAVLVRDYGWWCPTHVCRLAQGAPYADCGTVRFARTCATETMRRYRSSRRGPSYWMGLMARWAYARLSAAATRRADRVFTVSQHLADTWTARSGMAALPLGSGVPLPTPRSGAGKGTSGFTVAFMTRGSPGKGAEILVEAARRLKHPDGDWHFVAYGVAGDVDEQGVIERHPPVPHDEALRIMAGSDLVVVPSVYPEALPRTAVEAQLVGTPVVAVPNSGIAEAIAPNGGVLASRLDAEALAQALRDARRRLESGDFDLVEARRWIVHRHGIEGVRDRILEELGR